MQELITGIQQVGIGVENAAEAKYLYRDLFGMDVLVFDDTAQASLMTKYTGHQVHSRRAILSMNMQGGGGFEIWQFLSRTPGKLPINSYAGEPGLLAIKIKSNNVKKAQEYFSGNQRIQVSPVYHLSDGRPACWIIDPYGNRFQLIEAAEFFKKTNHYCGGVIGAIIGVSDMEESLSFYKNLLGISDESYNIRSKGNAGLEPWSEGESLHKILLTKNASVSGAFSKLLGHAELELVQPITKKYAVDKANRFWGDCGFIHLCFDVLDMDLLKLRAEAAGYLFTVDSADAYRMESAEGRFCYIEDPDGTLIELVETHKVPVLKKLGWYINLIKRKKNKPLPDWMVGLLSLNKVK